MCTDSFICQQCLDSPDLGYLLIQMNSHIFFSFSFFWPLFFLSAPCLFNILNQISVFSSICDIISTAVCSYGSHLASASIHPTVLSFTALPFMLMLLEVWKAHVKCEEKPLSYTKAVFKKNQTVDWFSLSKWKLKKAIGITKQEKML